MTTFTFQKVTYNGVAGFFATRHINGVYSGKQFGRTKEAAKAAFDIPDIDECWQQQHDAASPR